MTETTKVNAARLDSNMNVECQADQTVKWWDPRQAPMHVAGFAWLEKDGKYRRLPVEPDYEIPVAVDILANCTSGGQVRFYSDTKELHVRVKLSGSAYLNNMTPMGQCGFDLYVGQPGNQQYCATASVGSSVTEYTYRLFKFTDRERRCLTLNFPLYQGVEELWIGTDQDASIWEAPVYERTDKIVIYGTSITQGGCASRPGMSYPNILSRQLNMEFINLGFSGNGKGEPNVAKVIREIPDPALFVMDYEANSGSVDMMESTLSVFLDLYREKHPEVPILLVSCIKFAGETFDPEVKQRKLERKRLQKEEVEKRIAAGDRYITFYDGSEMLGENWAECTVDGIHPSDYGFMQMAQQLLPVIKQCLKS
ncbi:SGNH/GDSL hydrolase family protein [Paenibacillus lutrae]|uniref:SGNH hydrolase-type esterase domain-containing protein n=1 Tax=Paenibacillus lutrae TaxID=2078573 RepID=A0A7X3K177_9BACL|nr:SGNH/GDSL hydrolase family protein [Paenibacillus lutrae]MVP02019.1 hypothetical protein [Paenibacillus lutrae]